MALGASAAVEMALRAPAAASIQLENTIVKYGLAKEAGLSRRRLLLASPLFCCPAKLLRPTRRFSFSLDNAAAQTTELHPAMEAQNLAADAAFELAEDAPKGDPKQEEEPRLSQQTLLWRAIKLPLYTVALVPLTVGSAVAFYRTKVFYAGRFGLLLGSAVLVIAWLNLSNDVYDAETGADKGKRESVVNITGSREAVLVSAYACLALGVGGLIWGCIQAQNMHILSLEAVAIACGYIYQCPPFRLSYKGLGEPLCFIAFGPLSTTAFYLSQGHGLHRLPITGTILGAAVLVGITTTLILFCSHFHQIEGDRNVGKLSPLVRLGTEKGKRVVKVAVVGLYSLALVMGAMKLLPYTCAILTILTAPIGKMVVDFVMQNHDNKERIFLAKYYCVRLHAAFAAALGLGFVVAAQMGV